MSNGIGLYVHHRLILLLGLFLPTVAQAQNVRAAGKIERTAMVGVTIIDVARGRRVPLQTVVIEGARIVAVGSVARHTADTRIVDGRTLFMIPGLWDMHTHVLNRSDLKAPRNFPLMIANGITGIRNMHSDASLAEIGLLRRRVARGDVIGPRMVISSAALDGPYPRSPEAIVVADTRRARALVDSLVASGADLIKVYSYLPRDIYLAIASRARERGIPFAGHVPFGNVTASEAADAGQRSIEHLEGVIEQCSADERHLHERWRAIEDGRRRLVPDSLRYAEMWGVMRRAVETYDAGKCVRLLNRFVQRNTWHTPTFAAWQVVSRLGDHDFRNDTLLRYAPELQSERDMIARLLAASTHDARIVGSGVRRIVQAMQRRNVGLLAGTDAPSGGILPGFSLHEELASMVDAGLTPAEALRTATLNPARYLHATDSLGTVAPGKLADLVLLEADPLLDIRNTRRIRGVVLNGRYLDRETLNALRSRREPAAQKWWMSR